MGRIYYESRSSLENPQTPLSMPAEWMLDLYNGGRTDSGIRVSQLTALQIIAVRACVEIIARAIATLPIHIYEEELNDLGQLIKTIAHDHALYDVVHREPNPEMTRFMFLETFMAHALLWSNAYAEIQRDKAGRPIAYWPRNPAKTRPYRLTHPLNIGGDIYPQGTMVYVTTDGLSDYDQSEVDAMGLSRAERIILTDDMLHVQGLSLDGRIGLDVIEYARNSFGLSLAMEKYAGKFFGNGGRTSVVIEIPGNVSKENRDKIRQSYQEAMGGENMLRPIVLTQGVKITPISVKQDEAQFLESRDAQQTEICALFHVPPHMLGSSKTVSRSNTEQFAQEFLQFCLGPWLEAIKEEFDRKLLPRNALGRPGGLYSIDFDTSDLIRGDSDARQKFMTAKFGVGAWSINDCKAYDGENPLPDKWANEHFVPVNMMSLSNPPAEGAPGAPGGTQPPAKPGTPALPAPPQEPKSLTMDLGGMAVGHALPEVLQGRYSKVYTPLFRDAFNRVLAKKTTDSKVIYRTFVPVLTAITEDLLSEVAREFKMEGPKSEVLAVWVKDYIGAMAKRAAEWTEESCKVELDRAVKSIGIAAFEQIGGLKGRSTFRALELREGTAPRTDPVCYIVEHGDTDYSADGKMHGENDIDLNDAGIAQAQAAADWLKANVPNIRIVVSSDLHRAEQTAAPIAAAFGVHASVDHSLRPLKLGDLSGQPEDKLAPYIKDPGLTIPNGESVNDFIQRSPVFDYFSGGEPNTPTVLVLHSLNIAATIDKAETGNALANMLEIKKNVKSGGILAVTRDPADKNKYTLSVVLEGK